MERWAWDAAVGHKSGPSAVASLVTADSPWAFRAHSLQPKLVPVRLFFPIKGTHWGGTEVLKDLGPHLRLKGSEGDGEGQSHLREWGPHSLL